MLSRHMQDDHAKYLFRALNLELDAVSEAAQAWRFKITLAGTPLSVLFGLESLNPLAQSRESGFQEGAALLALALLCACAGYLLVLNARITMSQHVTAGVIANGGLTLPALTRSLQVRRRFVWPTGILSVLFFALLLSAATMIGWKLQLLTAPMMSLVDLANLAA